MSYLSCLISLSSRCSVRRLGATGLALALALVLLASPALAAPATIVDTTSGTATNNGTVAAGEYVGFTTGINSGFGNVIGGNSQLHVDSDASGNLNFGLIAGGGGYNDAMVIYIDSVSGGYTSTSTFNDTADGCRRAISGFDGTNRSILNFAPGFEADYAICMDTGFAGVWQLAGTGSHPYIASANRTATTPGHYEMALTLANLGTAAGRTFKYVATYLNPGNAFRSDEFHGVAQSTVPGGNPGWATVTLASGDTNVFTSYAAVVVSAGGSSAGYTTLKAAFDAINAGTHTGAIDVKINGDTTETVTAVLNASGSGSASYTAVLIQPSGGAARTISGTISGNALVTLNGADNVTIDGLNASGNALTLSNTSTSSVGGTSTLKFIADATNNTVTNASILGSATVNVVGSADGGNIWFSTGTMTGNDDNTISHCNIGPAGANLPVRLIWGRGAAESTSNSNVTITDNNLYDYFAATTLGSRGVDISHQNSDWTLSNNRFYQTAPRNTAAASIHAAIHVYTDTGGNFQITGNTIGYANSTGTGAYTLTGTPGTFYAIYLHVGTTTASSVQGNTIAGISVTSSANLGEPMNLIYVATGLVNIGDVTGNTLGSQTGTGSISCSASATTSYVSAIYNHSNSSRNISNNTIGSINLTNSSTGSVVFIGIRNNESSGSSAATTIANNTVGGASAGSIANNATGASSRMVGIQTEDSTPTISGNTVRNMTMVADNPGTGASAAMIGINQQAASTSFSANIAQNTIYNLVNNSPSAAVWVTGLHYTGPASGTHLVQRNLIYNLSTGSSSATARVNGIDVRGGVTTYQNNMIALGNDMTANSPQIYGIAEAVGTNNFYYNSVYIGGAGGAGSANSFAFQSTVQNNTRNYLDNIFYNARSNSGATGKHYAISVGGAVQNPPGLTSNYNVLYASGVGGFTGLFNNGDRLTLANWQTATGQDAASISADPQFVSTTDLHINPSALMIEASPVSGAGTPIAGITDDFDGDTRSLSAPDIGADEFAPLAVTLASFTAQGGADRVLVAWETVSELDNAGFNLYRSAGATGTLTLVASAPSQAPGSAQGFAYSFEDLDVQ
ncbi:MAG TPA: hypothetical protein VL334_12920, partial [Anaerolineae bacterium]|nr:hypothetical protein [Anaerolineae bacterium]